MSDDILINWKITQLAMELDDLLNNYGFVVNINHIDPSFLIVFENTRNIPMLVIQIKNLLGVGIENFKTIDDYCIIVFL